MRLYPATTIEWKAGPSSLPTGAKMAALEGDPTKEGPFVMRLQFPDGYHIPPHTHPKTERVTVVSGTMFLATGENLDRSAAKTLPAGTYGFWPAGMKHAAWFDGGTVIQLHGVGPWQINYLNPADDPRKAKKLPRETHLLRYQTGSCNFVVNFRDVAGNERFAGRNLAPN